MTCSAGFTAGWEARGASRSGDAGAAPGRDGPARLRHVRDGADQQRGPAGDAQPLGTRLVSAIRTAPGQLVVLGEQAAPVAVRTVPDDLGHRNLLCVPLRYRC